MALLTCPPAPPPPTGPCPSADLPSRSPPLAPSAPQARAPADLPPRLPPLPLRPVPLEQIIQDIAAMGFQRHQVLAVIQELQKSGQNVDLNVILDRLTNPHRY